MKKRGIGYASALQGVNYHFGHPDTSTVRLQLTEDLRYRLGIGAADLGQGLLETLISILSDELGGVPAEQVDLVDADTGVTPNGGATGASRQTAMSGGATQDAGRQLAGVLKGAAAELLNTPPGEIRFQQAHFYGWDGASLTLAEVVAECTRIGQPLRVTGFFQAPPTEPLDEDGQGYAVNQFSYATYLAEVEVDTDTGEVEVLRIDAFVDAGKIIRRQGAEMQIEGGAVMGLGHTLMEEFKMCDGQPETDSLSTYLIPSLFDAPLKVTSTFVDQPVPFGGLGAKGLAELSLVPVAPAIANAIYNAVGTRITRLPASPERVLLALLDSQIEKTGENNQDG